MGCRRRGRGLAVLAPGKEEAGKDGWQRRSRRTPAYPQRRSADARLAPGKDEAAAHVERQPRRERRGGGGEHVCVCARTC